MIWSSPSPRRCLIAIHLPMRLNAASLSARLSDTSATTSFAFRFAPGMSTALSAGILESAGCNISGGCGKPESHRGPKPSRARRVSPSGHAIARARPGPLPLRVEQIAPRRWSNRSTSSSRPTKPVTPAARVASKRLSDVVAPSTAQASTALDRWIWPMHCAFWRWFHTSFSNKTAPFTIHMGAVPNEPWPRDQYADAWAAVWHQLGRPPHEIPR
jgi:hypothetical protein